MYRSTTRWTTAFATAAVMSLPIAAAAQSPSTPQQQQPAQPPATQPPAMQPAPSQPPAQQPTGQQPTAQQPSASGQVDQAAAKQHLTEARETLSQLTSLPEAAKLQGEARTQVSQLISNFNELITTQANWRASYEKLNANLTTLIGAEDASAAGATGSVGTSGAAGTAGTAGTSGTAGATGTTGNTGAAGAATVDPAIRAKLLEFRTHLKAFEQSAGGAQGSQNDAMSPSNATGSTSNPSNPATAATGATGSDPNPTAATGSQPPTTAGATGTSGSAGAAPAQEAAGHAEADKHLDAISAILNNSKTGTLTKAQTTELKKHVEELRRLLSQQ